MITPLLLGLVSVLPQNEAQKKVWPWPPPGATWETVPREAFARARREKRPVMVYAATAD